MMPEEHSQVVGMASVLSFCIESEAQQGSCCLIQRVTKAVEALLRHNENLICHCGLQNPLQMGHHWDSSRAIDSGRGSAPLQRT